MAQPPIVKAKVKDRPALKDLANFVVPRVSHKWYNIGLQLFDPKDEEMLNNMRANTNRSLEDHCIDVFNHWLTTKENATWHKLLKVLKCRAVNLPNVAKDIEKLLDSRSTWSKGKRKIKRLITGEQSLPPVSEYHSVEPKASLMVESLPGPTQRHQGNLIFDLSDDAFDPEESDADEISLSVNKHNTSLTRSESQHVQCLAFDSHPPKKRSEMSYHQQSTTSRQTLASSNHRFTRKRSSQKNNSPISTIVEDPVSLSDTDKYLQVGTLSPTEGHVSSDEEESDYEISSTYYSLGINNRIPSTQSLYTPRMKKKFLGKSLRKLSKNKPPISTIVEDPVSSSHTDKYLQRISDDAVDTSDTDESDTNEMSYLPYSIEANYGMPKLPTRKKSSV